MTKTDPDAGYDGFTLFLVDMDLPGVIREKKLEKLGMHASDTALLAFSDVRVPADAVLGQVGKGFYHIMWELQGERLIGAAGCVAGAQRVFDQTLQYAQERKAFGRSIGKFQVIRHKFAEMATKIEGARQLVYTTAWRHANGEYPVREISMAKLNAVADRGRGRRRVHPDPRRRRLHEGVRRRARVARPAAQPHRRRDRRDHARRDRAELRALSDFAKAIADGYATEGAAIELGRGVHEGALHQDAVVRIPLAMINRHGLIAGATGTGKTRTLQLLAEALSAAGVPVFAADVKGDLSGLSQPGEAGKAAEKRQAELGLPFAPTGFPTEYLALGGIGAGVPVRATISDFGPQLLGKILSANKTQEQSLALVFHYADENGLPLVDLSDLRALLTFLDSDEGKPELKRVGGLSPATVGVLLRSLIGLEEGGGNELFGEPQFAIADLLRTAPDGRGVITCLELPGVQDKPALFSTALMWLLAELFEDLPEAGDLDKPKLVFFFDEAHLLFDGATDAFLDSVAQTVRLIRSKGVGIFFVTQDPQDLPSEVLGQLGSRIQHSLRAFTPDDAKALKATVSTYPKSDFYDLEELFGQMGIGEAAVTVLSERGIPTPVVHTRLAAPAASMGPAPDVDGAAKASPLYARYGERLDNPSARELLEERLTKPAPLPPTELEHVPVPKRPRKRAPAPARTPDVGDFLRSREGQRLQRRVLRGVFGMLRKRL